jgi:hypothetical protein
MMGDDEVAAYVGTATPRRGPRRSRGGANVRALRVTRGAAALPRLVRCARSAHAALS